MSFLGRLAAACADGDSTALPTRLLLRPSTLALACLILLIIDDIFGPNKSFSSRFGIVISLETRLVVVWRKRGVLRLRELGVFFVFIAGQVGCAQK